MSTTRRRFLQTTLGSSAVLSLGTAVPHFWCQAAELGDESSSERVLVVLQLTGGNDGLNTVIPVKDPHYRQARPSLAIDGADALGIDQDLALHPSLRGLADLWEAGHLAIVQGVGYPDPNRSHFESMDIWHTCQRDKTQRQAGWLGRSLESAELSTGGDVAGMHIGGEKQPLALASRTLRVPSIESLDRFRLSTGQNSSVTADIEQVNAAERAGDNELLDFVASSTRSALAASRRVAEAAAGYSTPVVYPETALGQKLRTVAQLIDAGLKTRVYYVALDGFDTHSQQAAAHAGLLRQVGDSVKALLEDLEGHGHGDRVTLMAFSEFGRRVAENASEGTDHGAAAPMFVCGKSVRAGLVGAHPSLTDLVDGDLKHHTDFRQVYATVLEDWLGWNSNAALGGAYEKLPLITS